VATHATATTMRASPENRVLLRRIATAALTTLALAALWLLAVPAARAAEPGVVPDLSWFIPDADKQRSAAALEDLGSKWVRMDVVWREVEPRRGNYDQHWLAEYEEALEIARAAGQKVILQAYNAPAWASGSSSSNVPRDSADYARFVGMLAQRFRGRIAAYEVWNEPNLSRFWSTGPDPAAYTQLLRAAYPSIKQADPAAKVVFGGLAGNDYKFLERAYAAGAKGSFDVMGTHPYTYCQSTSPTDIQYSGGRISRDSFLGYREVRASMLARDDRKPIWFTELGWNTSTRPCDPGSGYWGGGVSEAKQAEYLTRAYQLIEADPYVEVAIWYALRNPYWMHDGDYGEARFGLLRTDYSQKPAYAAFKAYAHGLAPPLEPTTTTPSETTTTELAPTNTTLSVRGEKRRRRAVGAVRGATEGSVRIRVEKLGGSRWRRARTERCRITADGRYAKRIKLPKGSLRIRARYLGAEGLWPSRSGYRRLRIG
jgi:hypothetical protein